MQILTTDRKFEARSANPLQPWGSTAPPPPGIGMQAAGVSVTTETALQLAAVWGSVALISDSIATLPIRQWKIVAGEARPIDDANEAAVIHQPWPEITQRDFITQGTVSLLLQGNLFGRITARDERLFPSQVQMQAPNRVSVRRNAKSGQVEVRYNNDLVPSDDVTRSMGLSVPGGIVGLNPIEYMRNLMGLGRATDLYAGAFFSNSAEPRGVIQVEGDLNENETLAMAQSWLSAHQGIGNAHLPAVLTGGATFNPISMNHADMEFLELMQWGQTTISGYVYRIPPHMFGVVDRTPTATGIEQQELGFTRNTLLVWLARWEDLLSSWLPPRQFVTLDLSERLRGDTLQRWQAYQIARVIGAKSSAEIRREEGLPTITDPGQAAIVESFEQPLNSSPIKQLQGDGGDHSAKPKEK